MPIPITTSAATSTARSSTYTHRRALLILDLQKEFLDPTIGRCLLPHTSNDPSAQPNFLNNINTLLPRFRNPESDIIWICSEFRAKRDFTDIQIDEKIHVVKEEVDGDPGLVDNHDGRKKGRVGPAGRPPLRTDAYLSIDTNHAPVAAGGKAAEFADVVKGFMMTPPDCVVTKTWYSAFKDTTLLGQLRGRVITSIYICGLMTNVGVLATAADAVRHGFDVHVITDAVGYRSREAHRQAITQMVDEYAVEEITSIAVLRDRKKGKSGKKGHDHGGVGATAMDKEELVRIMEEMELGRQEDEWEVEVDEEEEEEDGERDEDKTAAKKKKRRKRKPKPKLDGSVTATASAKKEADELAPERGLDTNNNVTPKEDGEDEVRESKGTELEKPDEFKGAEATELEKKEPGKKEPEKDAARTRVDLKELAAQIAAQNQLDPETKLEKSDGEKGSSEWKIDGDTVQSVPKSDEPKPAQTGTQNPLEPEPEIVPNTTLSAEFEALNISKKSPAKESSPCELAKETSKTPIPTLEPSIPEGGGKVSRKPPGRIIPLFEDGPIEVDEGSCTESDTYQVGVTLSPKRTRKDRGEEKVKEPEPSRPIAPMPARSRFVRNRVMVRKRPPSTPGTEATLSAQSTVAPPTSEDFNPEIASSSDMTQKPDKPLPSVKDETQATPKKSEQSNHAACSPAPETRNNERKAPSLEKSPLEEKPNPERTSSESPSRTKQQQKVKKARAFESTALVLGPGDSLGEGDSSIVYDLLPSPLRDDIFNRLKSEVSWRTMYHRGGEVPRLVAVQGSINPDGSFPIYRHPSDESPPLFPVTPMVDAIRLHVQEVLKHPLNHVLIQHYRSGNDYISEHSDKTLDIALGSNIVNVSLGAQRTMTLRGKKPPTSKNGETEKRNHQRIPMPHNSLFILGPATNRRWLHGIKQDRRIPSLKTPPELEYNGERISLTFRHITTFLSADESHMYGQGAVSKTRPRRIVNGPCPEAERLIEQFGIENHDPDLDWQKAYGAGFDVLHFNEPLVRILAEDMEGEEVKRVQEAINSVGREFKVEKVDRVKGVKVVDIDRERTEIEDPMLAQLYFERFYGKKEEMGRAEWVSRVKGILGQRTPTKE